MKRQYFLIKTEPDEYGWETFITDPVGRWDGVRNFSARNQLRAMRLGDYALFYHTGKAKEVVGVAEVKREAYPDPTAKSGDFSAVDFKPVLKLAQPVSLKTVKEEPTLNEMVLARRPRLSVQPVSADEFKKILSLGKTKLSLK